MSNQVEPKQIAILQKDLTDSVISRLDGLKKEGLVIPPNYSAQTALKSAFFALSDANGKNLLVECSKESVANALLDMVIQGLSPAKNQCYFIPYGNTCKMMCSYFGKQKILKSLSNIEDCWANVIFEGDEFEYENVDGQDFLVKHKSCLENRDNPIRGAYAVIKKVDGSKPATVMSRKEIETSWSQSKMKNNSVQVKFPQEMAKRTVINRAAKPYINTADDSDILIEAINRTTANEYVEDDRIDKANAIDVEIKESANSQEFVEEDIPQVPHANYEPTSEPQQAPQATWPQAWKQASQQAPQPQAQQTQEPIWNL